MQVVDADNRQLVGGSNEPQSSEWVRTLAAALLLGSVLVFLLVGSGVSRSGYHLSDDHQVVTLSHDLESESWSAVTKRLVQHDGQRFRPLYWVHLVATTYVVGTDFDLYLSWVGLQGFGAALLLYGFVRLCGMDFAASVMVALLVIVGRQSKIWWRTGPQENLGLLIVVAGLTLLAWSHRSDRKNGLLQGGGLLAFSLASLMKESFVVLLPALAAWNVLLAWRLRRIDWTAALRITLPANLTLLTVCAAELLWIALHAGGGPQRISVDLSPLSLAGVLSIYAQYGWATVAAALGVLYALVFWRGGAKSGRGRELQWIAGLVTVGVIVLAPQVLLHSGSLAGTHRYRYLIPGLLSMAPLIGALLTLIGKRAPRIGGLASLAMIAPLYFNGQSAWEEARWWADEGDSLREIGRLVDEHRQPGDFAVICVDSAAGGEWVYSLQVFLEEFWAQHRFRYGFFRRPGLTPTKQGWAEDLEHKYADGVMGKPGEYPPALAAVILVEGMNAREQFINDNREWFEPSEYAEHDLGWFLVWTPKTRPVQP